MLDAKERIRQGYIGEFGRDYHAVVNFCDRQTQEVIARQRADKLQQFILLDDTVLEFGVGLGGNLQHLRCQRRVGYDVSDAGREICTTAGIDFTTDIASIQKEKFSIVLCHHALEHVPDPVEVLEQIKEFLIPKGKLLLCVPFETNRRFRNFYPDDPNRHLFAWNVLTLGNLVSSVGFEIEQATVRPFGYERRLAFLAKYGLPTYRLGLWILRKVMPIEEILIVAKKPI
jgi:SAM-dependent methyltransferase